MSDKKSLNEELGDALEPFEQGARRFTSNSTFNLPADFTELIKKINPKSIVDEIIGVQPMPSDAWVKTFEASKKFDSFMDSLVIKRSIFGTKMSRSLHEGQEYIIELRPGCFTTHTIYHRYPTAKEADKQFKLWTRIKLAITDENRRLIHNQTFYPLWHDKINIAITEIDNIDCIITYDFNQKLGELTHVYVEYFDDCDDAYDEFEQLTQNQCRHFEIQLVDSYSTCCSCGKSFRESDE